MTSLEIQKFGEIQYLKGRLDELHKALLTITNIDRKRRVDQRIQKYFNKLQHVDNVAYHLYHVELATRNRAKEKSKEEIRSLLEDIITSNIVTDAALLDKIMAKINSY
jgi:hypothetical protein